VECQFSVEKVKGQSLWTSKTTQNWRRDQVQADPAPAVNLACAIVRPNLLSASECETLGCWLDGYVSCQHLAATCFLVSFHFLYTSIN